MVRWTVQVWICCSYLLVRSHLKVARKQVRDRTSSGGLGFCVVLTREGVRPHVFCTWSVGHAECKPREERPPGLSGIEPLGGLEKVTFKSARGTALMQTAESAHAVPQIRFETKVSPVSPEASQGARGEEKLEDTCLSNPPATGTGTLVITLEDENDNAPYVQPAVARVCEDAKEVNVAVIGARDRDIHPNADPFKIELGRQPGLDKTWRISRINNTHSQIALLHRLKEANYNVPLVLTDSGFPPLSNTTELKVQVCNCKKSRMQCSGADSHLLHARPRLPLLLPLLLLSALCEYYTSPTHRCLQGLGWDQRPWDLGALGGGVNAFVGGGMNVMNNLLKEQKHREGLV
ncbi:hypothetical protein P4O66_003266 [Electrophorus voltai]|uniref:Cadherin domain-containing protein n=1 Tax=Electrophorus voltai TaxID=2609070 RepID=A0AAD8YP70_9TELE|nr:hypothetical protein P4O66_003266 [Electrophorus voltai]